MFRLATVLVDVILAAAAGSNSALIVLLPTLTATGILTTSSAVTSLEIALPSALPVTFKVPAQLGTTVYSYSPAPHVLEEYTLIDGVTLSSTASDVASPFYFLM